MAAVSVVRVSVDSSASSTAGTMRLKRLIKPPAKPVVLDFLRYVKMFVDADGFVFGAV